MSLLSPGVGHVYCGRIVTGIILFSTWMLLPFCLIALALVPATWVALIVLLIVPMLVWLLVWIGGAWRAIRHAKRLGDDYELRDYNRPIVYSLLVFLGLTFGLGSLLACRRVVVEVFYIPTSSMQPTFLPQDRVLVEKLSVLKRHPMRGDLIVFRRPDHEVGYWIKRVIGLPGDEVRIEDGEVWINDEPLRKEALGKDDVDLAALGLANTKWQENMVFNETSDTGRYVIIEKPTSVTKDHPSRRHSMTVPKRCVYVLGDNRNQSRDSRQTGAIPFGDIVGYAKYRLLPASTWNRLGPVK